MTTINIKTFPSSKKEILYGMGDVFLLNDVPYILARMAGPEYTSGKIILSLISLKDGNLWTDKYVDIKSYGGTISLDELKKIFKSSADTFIPVSKVDINIGI